MANSLLLFLDEIARQIAYDNVSDDVLDFMLTNSSKLASQINAYNNNATAFTGGTIDEFVGQYKTGLAPRFQESYMRYVDAKLSSPEGVGLWLNSVFDLQEPSLDSLEDIGAIANSETAMTAIANSETAMNALIASETAMNALIASETAMNALIASETAMNAVAASETAMNAVAASETAINAIVASETAINAIVASETALYSIAVNNDTGLGLSKLASGIAGIETTAWENDTKWGAIKTTLDASSLFTKSGLLTDNGGTDNRTGNLITLIESAYSFPSSTYRVSITPRYTGCYVHAYTYNWSTGKHIMWGGHSSTLESSDSSRTYVKHYMYTPII